jgi:hypothetical protein
MKHNKTPHLNIPLLLAASIACSTPQSGIAKEHGTKPQERAEKQAHSEIYQLAQAVKANPTITRQVMGSGTYVQHTSLNGNKVILNFYDLEDNGPSEKDSLTIKVHKGQGWIPLEEFYDIGLNGFPEVKACEKAHSTLTQPPLTLGPKKGCKQVYNSETQRKQAHTVYQNRVSTLLKRLTQ